MESQLASIKAIKDRSSVQRTRSDSTPLRGTAAKSDDATGNAPLSRRWRSWSFPHEGIPLGSLTAREAARPFWNPTMLQQRLERIAECAIMEAPASPGSLSDSSDTEFSVDAHALDLQQNHNNSQAGVTSNTLRPKAEQSTPSTMDSESDDDRVDDRGRGLSGSHAEQLPSTVTVSIPLVMEQPVPFYSREVSTTVTVSTTNIGKRLATKSAPSLNPERNIESFPITIFSQSTSVL